MNDVAAFLSRILPYMLAGQTLEQAGESVLADDKRLMNAALANDETGKCIRREMMADVYKTMNTRRTS